MKRTIRAVSFVAALLLTLAVRAPADERISANALGIIPLPRSVTAYAGEYAFPRRVRIAASSSDEQNVAGFASAFLTERGVASVIVPASAPADLHLQDDAHDAQLGGEGYRLNVTASGVTIRANAGAGLFYGLQSLEQMFPIDGTAIHEAQIADWPQYRYRGIHLDVGRHFFPVSFVERYIDIAARYKLNAFHWHLTEDQGWRIEIKKYPRLISVASCREGTMIGHDPNSDDHIRYCGYYTQEQIREVVAYAKKRYVTIVPEIEMPGHSLEVLAAYPDLACKPGHYEVATTWDEYGVVCPSEKTIAFYEDVLTEVMALFPGPYIHTGGDEAPKSTWRSSPLVQSIMREQHLANLNDVQGWMDTRIESFLHQHGRRMIGWDEILEGNVTRSAIVMSWRGTSGGIVAATRGNDVIMTPDGPLYFDAAQGDRAYEPLSIGGHITTLRDVYDFDPVAGIPRALRGHVLGAQGNLWTEYIPTQEKVEYMLLPRLLALAEITWTPAKSQDWDSFVARTPKQYARFERENVHFRIPEPIGLSDTTVDADHVTVTLQSPVPGASMYYTTDGSMPTTSSTRYAQPFTLQLHDGEAASVRVITVLQSGRISAPARAVYERRTSAPVTP